MVTDQTRRNLLKAALFSTVPPLMVTGCSSKSKQQPALIGCAIEGRDKFSAVVANQFGQPLFRQPIPERGHGVATNQYGHAVVFGRRPGTFFLVFNYLTGEHITLSFSSQNRHYYGHGVYSHDGKYLFATEGESRTSLGIIGVYDVASNYKKVEEFTGFGLGPHEVLINSDGTLVVGVGGVHTHGRIPKNLATMSPSLSYLSAKGELIEQVRLPDHQLSIRHLAHDGEGNVFCGQQYRGDPDAFPTLIAMHQRGGELKPLLAEPEQWARFNHYIASIAVNDKWIVATSPRGNCYGIWSKETRKLIELKALPDASGVVSHEDSFQLSSGVGQITIVKASHKSSDSSNIAEVIHSGIQWDNHWSKIRFV